MSTLPHGLHLRGGPGVRQRLWTKAQAAQAGWSRTSRSHPLSLHGKSGAFHPLVGNPRARANPLQDAATQTCHAIALPWGLVVPLAPARWPGFIPGDLYPVNCSSEVKEK